VLNDAGDVAFIEWWKTKLIDISDKSSETECGNPFVGLREKSLSVLSGTRWIYWQSTCGQNCAKCILWESSWLKIGISLATQQDC
jgi:hypothetical protein